MAHLLGCRWSPVWCGGQRCRQWRPGLRGRWRPHLRPHSRSLPRLISVLQELQAPGLKTLPVSISVGFHIAELLQVMKEVQEVWEPAISHRLNSLC